MRWSSCRSEPESLWGPDAGGGEQPHGGESRPSDGSARMERTAVAPALNG